MEKGTIQLKTERLILRRHCPEDAEIFSPEDLNTETEAAEVSGADKNKKDKKKPEDSEE